MWIFVLLSWGYHDEMLLTNWSEQEKRMLLNVIKYGFKTFFSLLTTSLRSSWSSGFTKVFVWKKKPPTISKLKKPGDNKRKSEKHMREELCTNKYFTSSIISHSSLYSWKRNISVIMIRMFMMQLKRYLYPQSSDNVWYDLHSSSHPHLCLPYLSIHLHPTCSKGTISKMQHNDMCL